MNSTTKIQVYEEGQFVEQIQEARHSFIMSINQAIIAWLSTFKSKKTERAYKAYDKDSFLQQPFLLGASKNLSRSRKHKFVRA